MHYSRYPAGVPSDEVRAEADEGDRVPRGQSPLPQRDRDRVRLGAARGEGRGQPGQPPPHLPAPPRPAAHRGIRRQVRLQNHGETQAKGGTVFNLVGWCLT